MIAALIALIASACLALIVCAMPIRAADLAGNIRAEANQREPQRASLGTKHDYVLSTSILTPWIANNKSVLNTKALYVVEDFPRLIPIEPEKSQLKFNVHIPPKSLALIEHNEFGYFRLVNLSGRVLFLTVQRGEQKLELLAALGEEICIADPEYPEALLIPNDGIDRDPRHSPTFQNAKITVSKCDRKQLVSSDPLFAPSTASSFFKLAKREIAKAPDLHAFPASQKAHSQSKEVTPLLAH